MDSTQVNIAFEGLGERENITDYDINKMLRVCKLLPSLERKSKTEWVVRTTGFVKGATHAIATTAIVSRMWLVVTKVEKAID